MTRRTLALALLLVGSSIATPSGAPVIPPGGTSETRMLTSATPAGTGRTLRSVPHREWAGTDPASGSWSVECQRRPAATTGRALRASTSSVRCGDTARPRRNLSRRGSTAVGAGGSEMSRSSGRLRPQGRPSVSGADAKSAPDTIAGWHLDRHPGRLDQQYRPMNALRAFALILGIGAVAAWALGGDWRLSFGMWVSLTVTFWLARNIGIQEAEEWAGEAAEEWLRHAVESGAVTVNREVPDAP